MASIGFSQHLQTHVDVDKSMVDGITVREALDAVIALNPRLKSHVLDDRGVVRIDILSRGLPEPPCYDWVYRHGLDVDDSGESLVIGSTTGGLWVSEDRGDTWLLLSVHLPPVYCVRFA